MSCGFAHDDGAYVLGALSPADRQDIRAAPARVRRLHPRGRRAGRAARAARPGRRERARGARGRRAGPGHAAAAAGARGTPRPAPPYLGGGRAGRGRRGGRGRRALAVGQAADDRPRSRRPAASPTGRRPPSRARCGRSGRCRCSATVTLEQVTWGTRLGLACTYDAESVDYELPPEVDYTLYVRTRDGQRRAGRQLAVGRRPRDAAHAPAPPPRRRAGVSRGADAGRTRGAPAAGVRRSGKSRSRTSPPRTMAATSEIAAVHTSQPSHDSSSPKSPTVVGQDEGAQGREAEADGQERRDPVAPGEQEDRDHAPPNALSRNAGPIVSTSR